MLLNDWKDKTIAEMLSDFKAPETALDGAEVIIASYTYEDYSGSAYVLYAKDGKFYEVHGSHCSCYGLEEGGWDPEECALAELRTLIEKRSDYEFEGLYTKAYTLELLNKFLLNNPTYNTDPERPLKW